MIKTVKSLSKARVSPGIHRSSLWLLVFALPFVLTFIAPTQDDEAAHLVLGALTEHDTPTLITDAKGMITFANVPGLKLLGGKVIPDVVGHSITEWMNEDMSARHEGYFEQAGSMPLGSVIPLHAELHLADGIKVSQLEIRVGEADGDRIYRLEFTDP